VINCLWRAITLSVIHWLWYTVCDTLLCIDCDTLFVIQWLWQTVCYTGIVIQWLWYNVTHCLWYSDYDRLKLKVKALFIYIADRKASAYSYRFFFSACFQLRSITTGTLLFIRRSRWVSGRVDHRHLHTRTHLVVQGVRTLRQWPSLPKASTIWRSYCHELDLSHPTN